MVHWWTISMMWNDFDKHSVIFYKLVIKTQATSWKLLSDVENLSFRFVGPNQWVFKYSFGLSWSLFGLEFIRLMISQFEHAHFQLSRARGLIKLPVVWALVESLPCASIKPLKLPWATCSSWWISYVLVLIHSNLNIYNTYVVLTLQHLSRGSIDDL